MTENNPQTCPDCDSEITERNPLMAEHYSQHGSCEDCYDPTPFYPDLG